MTERARVPPPAGAGYSPLLLVTDPPVVTGVGLTLVPPVLAVVAGVAGRTETESPAGLWRPDGDTVCRVVTGGGAGVGLAGGHSVGGTPLQPHLAPAHPQAPDTALEAGQREGGRVAEVGDVCQVQGGEGGLSLPPHWLEVVQLQHGVGPVPLYPHTVPPPQHHGLLRHQPQLGS